MIKKQTNIPARPIRALLLTFCLSASFNANAQQQDSAAVPGAQTYNRVSACGAASVLKLPGDSTARRAEINLTKFLEGFIPGLQFTSDDGTPGGGSDMRVRGMTSAWAMQPLFNNNQVTFLLDGFAYQGPLDAINPNDIDSIVVQKDAVATSLYGSRAANGVVNIITKKGKIPGKTRIGIDASIGVNTPAQKAPALLNAQQYYETYWQMMRNGYMDRGTEKTAAGVLAAQNLLTPLGGYNAYNVPADQLIDPATGRLNPDAQLRYNDNWRDELTRTGIRQNYHLSAARGGKRGSFYLGAGYTNDGGNMRNTSYERFSTMFNGDLKITRWLSTGVQLSGTYSRDKLPNASITHLMSTATLMPPIYPVYLRNADGSYHLDENGRKRYDMGDDSSGLPGMGIRPFNYGTNVVAVQVDGKNAATHANWIAMPYLKLSVLKRLHLITTLHINGSSDSTTRLSYRLPAAGSGHSYRSRHFLINQRMQWQREIGAHNISLTAGYEKSDFNERTFSSPIGNAGLPVSWSAYASRLSSLRTQLNYSLRSRYHLSAGFNRDKSSHYVPSIQTQNYWNIGAGWDLHNERFMADSRLINFWRVRGSYGIQGNTAPTTNNIAPEFVKQVNAGTDLQLLGSRLSLTLDVYERQTFAHDFWSPLLDTASSDLRLRNRGIELTLRGLLLNQNNLKWHSGLMLSRNQNRITRMPPGSTAAYYNGITIEKGISMNSLFLPEWAGVNPENGRAMYYYYDTTGARNTTDDYQVAERIENRVRAGTALPWLTGSFQNSFHYKNFELSVLLTFGLGGKYYDSRYALLIDEQGNINWHTDVLNAWTEDNRDTDVPALTTSYATVTGPSTRFLRDASYLNIRNASLGYRLPSARASRLKLSSLMVYISAENIRMFAAKGITPQDSFELAAAANFYYPSRTVVFGLNIGL